MRRRDVLAASLVLLASACSGGNEAAAPAATESPLAAAATPPTPSRTVTAPMLTATATPPLPPTPAPTATQAAALDPANTSTAAPPFGETLTAESLALVAEPYRLYVADAAGGPPSLVHEALEIRPAISWAPDGRRLAFVAVQGEGAPNRAVPGQARVSELRIATLEDGPSTVIAESTESIVLGGWSASGRRFAFTVREGDATELHIATIGGASAMVARSEETVAVVRWSPAGERLAFVVMEPDGTRELHILTTLEGARSEATIELGEEIEVLTWSLEGTWLLLSHGAVLEVVDADAPSRREVLDRDGIEMTWGLFTTATGQPLHGPNVRWLPDGRLLVTVETPEPGLLLEVDAASGRVREIAELPPGFFYGDASVRPLSPDRSMLAVAASPVSNCEEGSSSTLVVVDLATGAVDQLSESCVFSAPTWFSDGAQIASLMSGGRDVEVVHVPSGVVTRLPVLSANEPAETTAGSFPSSGWLPGGGAVFKFYLPHGSSLIVLPADGGSGREFGHPLHPMSVSPNDRSAIFSAHEPVDPLSGNHDHVLQRVSVDDLQPQTLLAADPDWVDRFGGVFPFGEAWSPDGGRFAFYRIHRGSTCHGVRSFEVQIDGSELVRLPDITYEDARLWEQESERVALSPDGNHQAWLTEPNDGAGYGPRWIAISHHDGGAYRLVEVGAEMYSVRIRWIDNERLSFIADYNTNPHDIC